MPAICGAVRIDGALVPALASPALDQMMVSVAHRGASWDRLEEPGLSLGTRGTSIGRFEQASVVAALDGAVLNRSELAVDSDRVSDTDLIARLYADHGIGFPALLRGDFVAFAWDGRSRRAVIARDRQGIKPIYYTRVGDALLFGSEFKSILASGQVEPELDYESIEAFLSFGFVPGPRTVIRGVRKLHLGERLVVENGNVSVEAYWLYPPPSVPDARPSVQTYENVLLEKLDEAVRLRVGDARTVGAMLSGGLDSAMVVSLMTRHARHVKTFTVAFREAPSTNELVAARQISRTLGTEHEELELSLTDEGVSLEELAWRMDEPLAELSPLGLFALARLAASKAPVALSGQGADGIFGGLPHHRTAALAARLDWLPRAVRRSAAEVLRPFGGRLERGSRALAANGAAERFLAQCDGLLPDQRLRLALGPLAAVGGGAAARVVEMRLRAVTGHPTATYIFLDEQLAAVDSVLLYNDRAATGGPIDIRFPFLDHHVVEFAATVPIDLKIRGLERKYLLRSVARDLVPPEVLSRPKVGFFNAAIDVWLRAKMDDAVSTYLLDPSPRYAEFLDRGEVGRLVSLHAGSHVKGGGGRLLALLMLEIWLASVLPRALSLAK